MHKGESTSFSFAWGSCVLNHGGGLPGFSDIQSHNPNFVLFLGDLISYMSLEKV